MIAPYLLPIVLIVFFAAVINIILIALVKKPIYFQSVMKVIMKREVPNERICIQSTFWDSLVNPSLSREG